MKIIAALQYSFYDNFSWNLIILHRLELIKHLIGGVFYHNKLDCLLKSGQPLFELRGNEHKKANLNVD